jgi:hypothetical protein
MDSQLLINIILGTSMTVFGWFARELWAAVKELKTDLAKLREEVIREFVPRQDYREDVRELKDMIEKIFDILEKRREKL